MNPKVTEKGKCAYIDNYAINFRITAKLNGKTP